jgi:ferredoxin
MFQCRVEYLRKEDIYMKAVIDRDGCIACGLCTELCPEVFRMADDGLAEVYSDITPETEETAAEAADNCPTSVISVD